MTTNDPWAGLTAGGNGNFKKWASPGEHIVGTVTAKQVGRDANGEPCPQLIIRTDTGEEVTVTAGQAQLKGRLLELAPNAGDRIAITYTGDERREGGKTLKCFDVQTKPGDGTTAAMAPAGVTAADLL